MSTPIVVPEGHSAEGKTLITPLSSEQVTISVALILPLKKRISICGKIVQEDEPRHVKVRGDEIPIKTVTVEDSSGKAKITLWRDMAQSPVRPGDHVRITDVVVNVYNNTTSLQTTMLSAVEKCDDPFETKTVIVEAIGVEELHAEMFLQTGDRELDCASKLATAGIWCF